MKKIFIATQCSNKFRDNRFNIYQTHHTSYNDIISNMETFNPDAVIAGLELYNESVFKKCPNLILLSRVGTGIDNINLIDAAARNITILNTPDEPVQAVAELVIGQMINILRDIPNYYKYDNVPKMRTMGKTFSEVNILIIGYGRIGQRVDSLLKPFNCKSVYNYDIKYSEPETLSYYLSKSDIITLHIPLNPPDNRNFFNKDLLKLMKPDAFLINTSRGGVINEDDLYYFLKNRLINGAVLDVFAEEPYNGKFKDLYNVYCTPHIGSFTEKTRQAMEFKAFQNCVEFLNQNDK